MAQLQLLTGGEGGSGRHSQAVSLFPIQGFPFPVKREDGNWKAGFPLLQEFRKAGKSSPKYPAWTSAYGTGPSPNGTAVREAWTAGSPGIPKRDLCDHRVLLDGNRPWSERVDGPLLGRTWCIPVGIFEKSALERRHPGSPGTVQDQDGHLWYGALVGVVAGGVWLSLHSYQLR